MRDMVGKIVMGNDYSKVCVIMYASQATLLIKNIFCQDIPLIQFILNFRSIYFLNQRLVS